MTKSLKKGFTLLEILLVVGIISILAGIVILAINPTKQLGETRNAQRRSDVLTILNAIYQYSIDNNGALDTIGNSSTTIATSNTCPATGSTTDALILSDNLTTDSKYIVSIPTDPTADDKATASEYYVVKNSTTGRITVCAPNSLGEGSIPEGDATKQIEVTR